MRRGRRPRRQPWPLGDYEVGWGRPPKEHQFKKGELAPGRGGRPRGKSEYEKIQDRLMEMITVKINGKEVRLPYMAAMIEVAKAKGLSGDVKSFQMLMGLADDFGIFEPPPIKQMEIIHTITYGPDKLPKDDKKEE